MPVRVGTGSSAVDPSELRAAGVAPSKIMLGTGSSAVEVWTAVITVTPQAPTFLTASPWYTLPTQAGVTYTVSGTPGYSQTVTITATPQAGYALAGQTSWAHTYGPPARYSKSASSNTEMPLSKQSVWYEVSSHTMPRDGLLSVTFGVLWKYTIGNNHATRIVVNGSMVATKGPTSASATELFTVSRGDAIYSAGDVISFQAYGSYNSTVYRTISSWSWSMS